MSREVEKQEGEGDGKEEQEPMSTSHTERTEGSVMRERR
jgi:hypothetical protein